MERALTEGEKVNTRTGQVEQFVHVAIRQRDLPLLREEEPSMSLIGKTLLSIAALLLFVATALGAYASHGLEKEYRKVTDDAKSTCSLLVLPLNIEIGPM